MKEVNKLDFGELDDRLCELSDYLEKATFVTGEAYSVASGLNLDEISKENCAALVLDSRRIIQFLALIMDNLGEIEAALGDVGRAIFESNEGKVSNG